MLGVVNIVAGADSQLDDAGEGPCARCGAPHGRVPVAGVVSRVFTGTDSWTQPAGHLLCRACAWAYSAPRAREAIRHVFRAPAAVRELTIAQAYGELSRGGLEASASMVVPIRPGRRHLLPHAQWGRIATDHGCFAWSDADADRLQAVQRLRDAGVRMAAFTDAVAPWTVIVGARARGDLTQVLGDWESLRPWRAGAMSPWLELAHRLTCGGAQR